MWISVPIPVTTRIMSADSESSVRVKFALKAPAVIQSNTCCECRRDSGGSSTRRQTANDEIENDAAMTPHATAPEAAFGKRRPSPALTRKPRNGSKGISSSIETSPAQVSERLGVERFAVSEQRDDNRQP